MDSIRVALEPGFDQGRTAAWLIDWPGAYTYGQTREIALARAPSAAHRFVDWLAAHGEQPAPAPYALPEVTDERAAQTLPDGYVVRAAFAADERRVDRPEIEAHLRRLEHARADLTALVDRINSFARGGQSIAPDGRSFEEVLEHIAGSETWFVSRLDPAARYDGPRGGDADYLASSRAFLADGLRRLVAEQAPPRVDGKGERWTLAKVVRRSLYHSLDHLDELDRRLALAEGRVQRIILRSDAELDFGQLRHLFGSTGLLFRTRQTDDELARTMANSTVVLSAWDGNALVGFARLLSDEMTNAYVSTVAVAPAWQDRGLGSRLMHELMRGREHMKLVLESAPGAEHFYERLGFERSPGAFVRPRGVS